MNTLRDLAQRRRCWTVWRALSLLVVLIVCACSSPASPNDAAVRTGVWGGQHLRLDVAAGGAQADFDCAHAAIDEPLTLDARMHFEAAARYVEEAPGPVRPGGPPERPARFVGDVNGDEMTLTVTLADNGDSLGTFRLTFGAAGVVRKCR